MRESGASLLAYRSVVPGVSPSRTYLIVYPATEDGGYTHRKFYLPPTGVDGRPLKNDHTTAGWYLRYHLDPALGIHLERRVGSWLVSSWEEYACTMMRMIVWMSPGRDAALQLASNNELQADTATGKREWGELRRRLQVFYSDSFTDTH